MHVEMEDRFGAARALFGQALPARIAHARSAVAAHAIADEIDVDVLISGPMALEIVEESGPVGLQTMHLEIAQRKRESMVDTSQSRRDFSKPFDQPFRNAAPRPIFARAGRGQDLAWQ